MESKSAMFKSLHCGCGCWESSMVTEAKTQNSGKLRGNVWPQGSSGKRVSHTGKAGLTKALFSMGGTEQWKGHSKELPTYRLRRRRRSLKTKPYPYPLTEVSMVVKMLFRGKDKLFSAVEVRDSFKPLWKSYADSVLVMEQRTSSLSMQRYCGSHGSLPLKSTCVLFVYVAQGPRDDLGKCGGYSSSVRYWGPCCRSCSPYITRVKQSSRQDIKNVLRVLGSAGVVPCHSLFMIFVDRISRLSHEDQSVQSGDFKIASFFFVCCPDPENGWMDAWM